MENQVLYILQIEHFFFCGLTRFHVRFPFRLSIGNVTLSSRVSRGAQSLVRTAVYLFNWIRKTHALTWRCFVNNYTMYFTCNLFYKVYSLSAYKLFLNFLRLTVQTTVSLTSPLTQQTFLFFPLRYSRSAVICPLSNNDSHYRQRGYWAYEEPMESYTFKVITRPKRLCAVWSLTVIVIYWFNLLVKAVHE